MQYKSDPGWDLDGLIQIGKNVFIYLWAWFRSIANKNV